MKLLLVLIALLSGGTARATSYSDLAEEEFEKGPAALAPLPRSPFLPGAKGTEEVDLATTFVQGIVWGKDRKMALLSGRIVRPDDRLGRYHIQEIEPDRVTLSYGEVLYPLRLPNYVPPIGKKGGYQVEFQGASLRDALQLLAKAAAFNLIVPEDLSGQVTVSFHGIGIMEALRSILRVNGYEYAMESGIIRVGKPDAFVGGTDLLTETFRLEYATAKDLMTTVKPLLSDRGQVIADERTNTLTVKDRDPIVSTVRSLVGTVDRKDHQVQIEARIVDATRDFSRSLGIRWGLNGTRGNVTLSGSEEAGLSSATDNPLNVNLGAESPTSGIGFIIGQITGAMDLEAQLTAAEQHGEVKILSKPTVVTLNNAPAKIRSGTKIYVKSTSSINIGTSGAAAAGGTAALQEIDTGIELTVTPQISVGELIKLKIEASQSEADFSRTVDGIPAVVDSTASTTVLLENGSTTVIGGLYRVRTSKTKRGVPGLQNVPIVGLLFQSRSKTKTDTELMIFITPKIIKF